MTDPEDRSHYGRMAEFRESPGDEYGGQRRLTALVIAVLAALFWGAVLAWWL